MRRWIRWWVILPAYALTLLGSAVAYGCHPFWFYYTPASLRNDLATQQRDLLRKVRAQMVDTTRTRVGSIATTGWSVLPQQITFDATYLTPDSTLVIAATVPVERPGPDRLRLHLVPCRLVLTQPSAS